jgi:anti-sigma regulatory factor (Ser/Thr protein kinase)
MVDATHISFAADDRSYFSLIKKEIHRAATEAAISTTRINELDLVVAEMTSNLFKYGEQGEILMGIFPNDGNPYIELISIDNGPGMVNPSRMLQDGISTTKSMGHGFGSMKRLSDTFDLYSLTGWGTIVLSRIYSDPEKIKKTSDDVTIYPIIVAKPGESESGDGCVYKKNTRHIKIMLADGLGHGIEANKAINEAAVAFKACPDYNPVDNLRYIHDSIKKTRGAVMNITCYDSETKTWSCAGIGNIATRLFGPVNFRSHMSYNGIVGHNIPGTMTAQEYPANQFNQVMLCSDGIKTRFDLAKYPQIYKAHPSILAAAVYKDHARRNDDMSVVIIKAK